MFNRCQIHQRCNDIAVNARSFVCSFKQSDSRYFRSAIVCFGWFGYIRNRSSQVL
ncbi:hypothetical protein GLOIN_2v1730074, partial [Rhizophagus irregularis DAOM 181602=DAOM 197198]